MAKMPVVFGSAMDSLRSLLRRDKNPIYVSLPGDDGSAGQNRNRAPTVWRNQNRRTIRLAAATMGVVILGFLAVSFLQTANSLPHKPSCDTPELGYQCDNSISHSWGQYSPYFSVPSTDYDPSVPRDCVITFAQVLSRHGARDPTLGKSVQYAALIMKIQEKATTFGPDFQFLKSYNYSLGADQLTKFGQQQMVNSGIKFYNRYRDLIRSHHSSNLPFIRAADQDRVVMSAQNFTQGFRSALLSDFPKLGNTSYPILTIPEGDVPGTNNTLSHGLCAAFEKPGKYSSVGSDAQAAYASRVIPPVTARLNSNLPGANLTDSDTIFLMDLCPFHTVASSPSAREFCKLFSKEEWEIYDYYQTLGKFYGYGPGNPLGPTQGVGWVNELTARLTGEAVKDSTSTNRTLDANDETFPLGRAVYMDFSHDNDMMGHMSALGVWEGLEGLSKEVRESKGNFSAANSVPFGARVYVEKMKCRRSGKGKGPAEEEYVRVLVDDRVVGFEKRCGWDKYGRCGLKRFVDGLDFAREGGRWGECFE